LDEPKNVADKIVITKAGKSVARLIPEGVHSAAKRVPGIDKGKLRIADDFDSLSLQDLDEWYGPAPWPL